MLCPQFVYLEFKFATLISHIQNGYVIICRCDVFIFCNHYVICLYLFCIARKEALRSELWHDRINYQTFVVYTVYH